MLVIYYVLLRNWDSVLSSGYALWFTFISEGGQRRDGLGTLFGGDYASDTLLG